MHGCVRVCGLNMGGVWLDGGRFVTTTNANTTQLMGFVAMTAPHSPAVSHQHTDPCVFVAEFAVACFAGGVDLASVCCCGGDGGQQSQHTTRGQWHLVVVGVVVLFLIGWGCHDRMLHTTWCDINNNKVCVDGSHQHQRC